MPLEDLFRAVWHQAGGDDRGRGYAEQLKVTTSFGPMFQFVDQGGMTEIEQVFAGLNVALAALGSDAEVSRRRLMDVQHRATSIATLNQAPRLVVQIIEDVLAQTTASREGGGQPQASLTWQRELSAACRNALTGRFPFAADGPDADLAGRRRLPRPERFGRAFLASDLAPLIDTTTDPLELEARGPPLGLRPRQRRLLRSRRRRRRRALPAGRPDLADPGRPRPARRRHGVARRRPRFRSRSPATRSTLAWPGPNPDQGLAIAFAGAGAGASQVWPGPWGLLRFLDGLHLRARDDGRRFLIDVRLADTRAYLDLAFARPSNPAAASRLMTGLACPPTL